MADVHRERIAALVLFSGEMSVEQITDVIGVRPDRFRHRGSIRPDAPVQIPAKENSWEICERADSSVPLSELIDRLSARVLPLREKFIDAKGRGCAVKLELVQWISATDSFGPGFALESDLVSLLAATEASVDVDQYVG
jgi:Domain of unknown function (DUF4279)